MYRCRIGIHDSPSTYLNRRPSAYNNVLVLILECLSKHSSLFACFRNLGQYIHNSRTIRACLQCQYEYLCHGLLERDRRRREFDMVHLCSATNGRPQSLEDGPIRRRIDERLVRFKVVPVCG